MIPPSTVAAAFARAVSEEIDHQAPLDFEVLFEIACDVGCDFVHPDTSDALELFEEFAEALDSMLQSARALA